MDIVEWADSSLAVSQQVDEWMAKLADICDKRNYTADQMSLATEIIQTMAKQDEKIHQAKLAATYLVQRKEEIDKRYKEVTAERIRSQLNIKRLDEAIERIGVQEEAKRTTDGEERMKASFENPDSSRSPNVTAAFLETTERSRFVEKRKGRRSISAKAGRAIKTISQRVRSLSRNRP